jgi:hypothetical protein
VPTPDGIICHTCTTPPGDEPCPECGGYDPADWSIDPVYDGGVIWSVGSNTSWDLQRCQALESTGTASANFIGYGQTTYVIAYTGSMNPPPPCVALSIEVNIGPGGSRPLGGGVPPGGPGVPVPNNGFNDALVRTVGADSWVEESTGRHCLVLPTDGGVATLILSQATSGGAGLDTSGPPDSMTFCSALTDDYEVVTSC